jgi:hypothetical protein
LPAVYKEKSLDELPYHFTILTLPQRGDYLSGKYEIGARFAAKVETGEFNARIRGSAAEIRPSSTLS